MRKFFTGDFYQRNAAAVAGLFAGATLTLLMVGFSSTIYTGYGWSDERNNPPQSYIIE